MDSEVIFKLANTLALLGWLLLIASRWIRALRFLVTAAVVPLLLGVAYVIMVVLEMPKADGGFDSLAGVMTLFENPRMVLVGWLHFLAFDLLIGTWIWQDAERKGVPWLAALPALFFTFLFGPAGFLLYILIRAGVSRSFHAEFPAPAK
ncbi:MAG: ABA4-like family protein [Verrucomicrobiota bacterium]